jgi:hypothetical protein
MRSLGATWVDAYCVRGYQASIDVSALPDDLAAPDVRLRLRSSKCGATTDRDATRLDAIPS